MTTEVRGEFLSAYSRGKGFSARAFAPTVGPLRRNTRKFELKFGANILFKLQLNHLLTLKISVKKHS